MPLGVTRSALASRPRPVSTLLSSPELDSIRPIPLPSTRRVFFRRDQTYSQVEKLSQRNLADRAALLEQQRVATDDLARQLHTEQTQRQHDLRDHDAAQLVAADAKERVEQQLQAVEGVLKDMKLDKASYETREREHSRKDALMQATLTKWKSQQQELAQTWTSKIYALRQQQVRGSCAREEIGSSGHAPHLPHIRAHLEGCSWSFSTCRA